MGMNRNQKEIIIINKKKIFEVFFWKKKERQYDRR